MSAVRHCPATGHDSRSTGNIAPFFIDREHATRRHPPVISRLDTARRTLFCLVLGLAIVGCGKEGDTAKKVDVSAQVAGLKGNGDAKAAALAELAAGGPNSAAAVKDIIPLLKDEDALTRRLAAYALGQIGPAAKEAIPNLTPLLKDPDRAVMTATLNAIRAIDPSKAPAESIANTMN
jgi:hypothetical protein